MEDKSDLVPEYYKKIYMCLPGGGFRAAIYSLGVLSFLDNIGLEPNIVGISTVSGGSITGARYAVMKSRKGEDFKTFFNSLKDWLLRDQVVQDANKKLKQVKLFKHKSKNLINAFSLVYADYMSETLGDIEKGIKENNKHFVKAVFNASDFNSALPFRFNVLRGYLGNRHFRDRNRKQYTLDQIKVADSIAASSCFPGGFEPLRFPKDFIPNTEHKNQIALMDGGIIDNHGINSLMTSSYDKETYFIVCHAGKSNMPPYVFNDKGIVPLFISILLNRLVLIIAIGLTAYFFYTNSLLGGILGTMLSTLFLIGQILYNIFQNKAKKTAELKSPINISRSQIGNFVMERIHSLLKMNESIFLTGSKRNSFTQLYSNYPNQTSSPSIDQLTYDNGKPVNTDEPTWKRIKKHTGEISPDLQNIAEKAANFPTTLWFPDKECREEDFNAIIKVGQASVCYDLIKDMSEKGDTDHPLFKVLIDKWEKLNELSK